MRSLKLVPPTALLAAALVAASCGAPTSGPWAPEVGLHPGGDVVAAGGEIIIRDSVPGDVMAVGESTDFAGYVGGSYLSAARDVEVGGRVDGSVRAMGGSVRIETDVGRNVTLAGGSVELAEAAHVAGNAYLAGGSVRLDGTVDGNAYVGSGDVVVGGTVAGDLRVEGSTLRIEPGARILGELRYRLDADGTAAVATDAEIGSVLELAARDDGGPDLGFYVLRILAFLVCGALVIALLQRMASDTVATAVRRPGAALGIGLLWFFLAPAAAVAVGVTLVGAPVAVLLLGMYAASLYLAPIVPALWIGREIVRADLDRTGEALKAFAVGGALVALAIVLPWVGFLARALAVFLGSGAILLTLNDRRRPPAGV